jgi:hypothetical protein
VSRLGMRGGSFFAHAFSFVTRGVLRAVASRRA